MNNALSMDDFAKLNACLVVPLTVAEMAQGREALDEEGRYALHDALCEIDPDSALLAIALSAQHIAARYIGTIPVAVAVKFEGEKILQEYGPDWLANYYGGPVDETELFDMLHTLPEDLEAMADLLDALRCSPSIDSVSAALCEILSIQARAHKDVADYILSELDKAIFDESELGGDAALFTIAQAQAEMGAGEAGSNVIPFPLHRTRQ